MKPQHDWQSTAHSEGWLSPEEVAGMSGADRIDRAGQPERTCAELRPYEGRPGAMDAFALPSRMGRRLVWRDGRVDGLNEICTQAAPAERWQLSGE